jgi:G:T-mismatch repair DNA endonuclease (very short patch repair protein)
MRIHRRQRIDTDLFRGRDALQAGALRAAELRSDRYRRIFRDVYAPGGVAVTHELRCRAAATVQGVALVRPSDPVELIVPYEQRSHRRAGLNVRCIPIGKDERTHWHGIGLATPLRAAYDLLLRRDIPRAVADVDALLRAGLVDAGQLAVLAANRHDHGITCAREAVQLLDARAESPPESEVRVLLVQAGLRPTPQLEVWDDRGLIGRVDLGFEEEKVAVEYDGVWHADAAQLAKDRSRLNRLQSAGWEVVFVTAEQLRGQPHSIVPTVQAALTRRRRFVLITRTRAF